MKQPAVDVLEEAYAIRVNKLGVEHPYAIITLDALEKARAATE
jgi:hypothetical protein